MVKKTKSKKKVNLKSPSKLELDVGPRVEKISKKVYPQFMKAWWAVFILILILGILGFVVVFFVFNKLLNLF